ncbi:MULTISPECIES: septum formation initiator family protein [unclassified Saccharibacter]|uniref:FtsB family cell division protein n=1 Tax=unclassified Saccharibacter TaxID=2648722 RepID=UPI00132B868C|nr:MULTISPECIES: septum formation initiator family protein [unclassified Saccharibacter]MXV36294.1 septation inhibitor protein [Saccharibacter sp. EH611]MXV57154.1 septation inhibitor protein [Saccharibacter sp. EH70]MXV66486.1 septation inhibitor protein [Saccharibacter sp. EH60]
MSATSLMQRGLRATLPPCIFLALTAYFIWNALHGAHGIEAYQQRSILLSQAQQALHDAHQEQDIWHRRVTALGEQALDPDMLDERSRTMLNNTREGDIVVPYGDHEHLY